MTSTAPTAVCPARPVRRGPLLAAALSAAALLALSSAASAQTQPADGAATTGPAAGDTGTRTRSPFWGDRGADRYDRYRDDDEMSFAEKFPVDLAAEVAPAKERYVGLKWTYQNAQNRLRSRVADLRRQFEGSSEYQEMARQREEAQDAIRRAQAEALAPLANDEEYQTIVQMQAELEQQIREAHQQPNPDMERIRGMAELAMDYNARRRARETELLANNSTIQSSRERLREMAAREDELEEQYDRQVRDDSELAELRSEIGDLRSAYLAAGAYYDSVVRAADIAADFAYRDSYWRNRGSAYDPYYEPYGYGYGAPWWWWGGSSVIIAGPGVSGGSFRQVTWPTPIFTNVARGALRHTMVPGTQVFGDNPRDGNGGGGERPRTRD